MSGCGEMPWVTTHGLSGALATLLFESDHADSSVAMRTGHRDMRSLKSNKNLRGWLGKRQQGDLFGYNQTSNEEDTDHRPQKRGSASASYESPLLSTIVLGHPSVECSSSGITTFPGNTVNITINNGTTG